MKKPLLIFFLIIVTASVFTFAGCKNTAVTVTRTVNGNFETYYQMSDGTWECNNVSYKYRLVISGRIPSSAHDTAFVYLSNIPDISFERAWKAAGLSSNSDDYFKQSEAVLVEWQ